MGLGKPLELLLDRIGELYFECRNDMRGDDRFASRSRVIRGGRSKGWCYRDGG